MNLRRVLLEWDRHKAKYVARQLPGTVMALFGAQFFIGSGISMLIGYYPYPYTYTKVDMKLLFILSWTLLATGYAWTKIVDMQTDWDAAATG